MKTRFAALLMPVLMASACSDSGLTDTQKGVVQSLSLPSLLPTPIDPSNRFSGLPQAEAFGATLFFDAALSRDGNVACATCHVPEKQFQDGLALSKGAGTTDRRAMPLAGVAHSPWLFWDGRKDSLWSQALGPMESQVEHAGNRTLYAHYIQKAHRERYEALFGPMPDISAAPPSAGPNGTPEEQAAWGAMTPETQKAVNGIFANLGKAIGAFERSLVFPETRFDRFAKALAEGKTPEGDSSLSAEELTGLKLFIGTGQCLNCHNGPRFTDDHFHNTGVPQADGLPADHGRADAIAKLDADPFNCLGEFSDAKPDDCGELKFMSRDHHVLERAFKTPSLRGVAGRPPYMHSGQIATLEAALQHYSAAPPAPSGDTELTAKNFTDADKAALIAFLKTLGG